MKLMIQYELTKLRDKTLLRFARLVPDWFAYWVYIVYGGARIRDNEVVPEVRYTELLGRTRNEL